MGWSVFFLVLHLRANSGRRGNGLSALRWSRVLACATDAAQAGEWDDPSSSLSCTCAPLRGAGENRLSALQWSRVLLAAAARWRSIAPRRCRYPGAVQAAASVPITQERREPSPLGPCPLFIAALPNRLMKLV